MFLNYEFVEQEFIHTLYTTEDIVSALGGIAASIKLFTGGIATVMMFMYLINFG